VVIDATGSDKLPALRLADGTVLIHSKAILAWVEARASAAPGPPV